MSVYIAATRTIDGQREVFVEADVYNAYGKYIGHRCYGWHPEQNVTSNGVDVCELWLASFHNHCETSVFTNYVRDVLIN